MPLLHPALLTAAGTADPAAGLSALVGEFLLDDRERTAPLHLLAGLTRRLAASEPIWRSLVRHDPVHRWYTRLVLSGTVEVWIIGWSPGQFTPVHDHGGALGALAVAEGTLEETLYCPEWHARGRRTHAAGGGVGFAPHHVHRVGNAGTKVATSIHAYSPPGRPMRYARPGPPEAALAGGGSGTVPAPGGRLVEAA